MKLFIGADHAGYELKEELKPLIKELGFEIVDKGAFAYDVKDDYPDFCLPVAEEVAKLPDHVKGIVIGGSSVGEAIVANRLKGVRAVGYYGGNIDLVKLSREHNNANILSLGARLMPPEEAKYAVKIWLTTPFTDDDRHK